MGSENKIIRGLTGKAVLTGAASLVNYGGTVLVGLLVTPITVSLLGMNLYGIWVMLAQLTGYVAMMDLCPTRVLKLTLATEQHSADHDLKRRQVGAALLLGIGLTPLFMATGAAVVWGAPMLIRADPQDAQAMQWAIVVMVANLCLTNLLTIPASVLRAMNLDYYSAGVTTAITIVTGAMDVVVLYAGWGLVGLSLNRLGGNVLSSLVRFNIVRRRVTWFGVRRPHRKEVYTLFKRSLWFASESITTTLGQRSELLVIGTILGPAVAGVYSLTKTFGGMLYELTGGLLSAVNPGVAGIVGKMQFGQLRDLRLRLQHMALVAALSLGGFVALMNRSFISVWVGPGKYAGDAVTLLLAAFFFFGLMVRQERTFMGALLLIRPESAAATTRNIASFLALIPAVYLWGVLGAVLPMVVGEACLWWYYHRLLNGRIGQAAVPLLRLAAGLLGMVLVAGLCPWLIPGRGWGALVACGVVGGILITVAVMVLLFDRNVYRYYFYKLQTIAGQA